MCAGFTYWTLWSFVFNLINNINSSLPCQTQTLHHRIGSVSPLSRLLSSTRLSFCSLHRSAVHLSHIPAQTNLLGNSEIAKHTVENSVLHTETDYLLCAKVTFSKFEKKLDQALLYSKLRCTIRQKLKFLACLLFLLLLFFEQKMSLSLMFIQFTLCCRWQVKII